MVVIPSYVLRGIQSLPIRVETDMMRGLPVFTVVGLADTQVQEAKERIRSALTNSGYAFPAQKVIINLAPADIRKASSSLDLPMAMGILLASGQITSLPEHVGFVGELSLGGAIRPVRGVISYLLAARAEGKTLVLPKENLQEASMCQVPCIPVGHLRDVLACISNEHGVVHTPDAVSASGEYISPEVDMMEIDGLDLQKRALMIAAVGAHNVLMTGGPGTGKSMLAKALAGILPPLTHEEALEVMQIYSVVGKQSQRLATRTRPFRSVHHTSTAASLTGGGVGLLPGELSLAHHGVLFCDELPEFGRRVLEVLREPLEEGHITISRVSGRVTYPTKCMLVAAQNPCPCGYAGVEGKTCICTEHAKERYSAVISGPLLDRIDVFTHVPRVSSTQLLQRTQQHSSQDMRNVVAAARAFAREYRAGTAHLSNAHLSKSQVQESMGRDPAIRTMLVDTAERLQLSTRGLVRLMRVSRSIADLEHSQDVQKHHVLEAVSLRRT